MHVNVHYVADNSCYKRVIHWKHQTPSYVKNKKLNYSVECHHWFIDSINLWRHQPSSYLMLQQWRQARGSQETNIFTFANVKQRHNRAVWVKVVDDDTPSPHCQRWWSGSGTCVSSETPMCHDHECALCQEEQHQWYFMKDTFESVLIFSFAKYWFYSSSLWLSYVYPLCPE